MEHKPSWEADSRPDSQILRILWKQHLLPNSAQPATGPQPQSGESNAPPKLRSSELFLPFRRPSKFCTRAACLAHLTLLNFISPVVFSIGWIYSSSRYPACSNLLTSSHTSKCSPLHPVLERPQSSFYPWRDRPSIKPTQNKEYTVFRKLCPRHFVCKPSLDGVTMHRWASAPKLASCSSALRMW
jgi:hypothetical protein